MAKNPTELIKPEKQIKETVCNSSLKKAVILFNLGGPDSLKSVKPFLFNLFNDRHIINLPQPIRWLLAKYISWKRAPFTKEIYKLLNNKSPILAETKKQKLKLESFLGANYEVFIAMRYWHPFIEEILPYITLGKFKEVILLPLYPQFSTTTSLSSIRSCINEISLPKKIICCYYEHPLFLEAHAELISVYYQKAKGADAAIRAKPIILFSAHGLPIKIIEAGDPYEFQINITAKKIIEKLGLQLNLAITEFDWEICYQSKVGRLKWLEPDTEATIKKYANRPIVLVPIAFVSEHSETLVELDIEYAASAKYFYRVPTLGDSPKFIECLAKLCKEEFRQAPCPKNYTKCFCNLYPSSGVNKEIGNMLNS